jgi:hypothetical protein
VRSSAAALLAAVFLLAACGGSDSTGQDSFRVASVDLKTDLSISETVRLAKKHKLGIREIVAVQRRGGDELTGNYVPDPDASPEQAEQQFLDEDLSDRSGELNLQERRALEEAAATPPAVRNLTVCGSSDAIQGLDSDARVDDVFVNPERTLENCP